MAAPAAAAACGAGGIWGPCSANYDWCEANFRHTKYVAELCNTLSSVPIILAAVFFARRVARHGYGRRFAAAATGLGVVGVGSVAFHGTLTRWGQVLDEVPMLWTSMTYLWICLCNLMTPAQEARLGPLLAVCLTLTVLVATSLYAAGSFGTFITIYIVTVGLIVVLSASRLRTTRARKYVLYALGFYVGGFLLLWVPEQVFCGNRLETNHGSGLLALPVPLHAFFHLTSSAGPVAWLTFAVFEHLERTARKPHVEHTAAPEFFGLVSAPEVVPAEARMV